MSTFCGDLYPRRAHRLDKYTGRTFPDVDQVRIQEKWVHPIHTPGVCHRAMPLLSHRSKSLINMNQELRQEENIMRFILKYQLFYQIATKLRGGFMILHISFVSPSCIELTTGGEDLNKQGLSMADGCTLITRKHCALKVVATHTMPGTAQLVAPTNLK